MLAGSVLLIFSVSPLSSVSPDIGPATRTPIRTPSPHPMLMESMSPFLELYTYNNSQ